MLYLLYFLHMGYETRTRTASTSGAVTVGNTTTVILATNPDRKAATFVNDSDEAIYLQLGAAAALNQGIRLNASGGAFTIDKNNLFTGAINGICASGSKVLVVTETP